MPNKICKSCLNDLNIAYRFYKKCENSNSVLNTIVPAPSSPIKPDDNFPHSENLPLVATSSSDCTIKKEEFPAIDNNIDDIDNCIIDYEIDEVDADQQAEKEFHEMLFEDVTNDTENICKPKLVGGTLVEIADEKDIVNDIPKIVVLVPKDQAIVKKSRTSSSTRKNSNTDKKTKRIYRKRSKEAINPESDLNLTCCICGSEYKNPQDLERHIKRHTNDKQFMCS